MTEPSDRRQRFADRLRELREAVGLRGNELAKLTGWDNAKISRLQRGQQTPTETDIRAWCEHTDPSMTDELLGEFGAMRADEARWSRQLRTGHRALQQAVAGVESHASRIRVFEFAVVPGLLQTAGYARALFRGLSAMAESPSDTDAAVAARLERQHVLYDSSKRIDLLMHESALRARMAGPDVMAAQIDRIRALSDTVAIGVIPLNAELDVLPTHGVSIYDDLVEIETVHTAIVTSDPHDVALYHRWLDQLWKFAVTGPSLRRLLDGLA